MGHNSSRGEHFQKRIRKYMPRARLLAENIDYGSTTPREVLSQLTIDDGVAGRGHRKNNLDPSFTEAGVSCGPHAKFGTMCVIDFADRFRE